VDAQKALVEEQGVRHKLFEELQGVQRQLGDLSNKAAKERGELENKLKGAQDYIEKLHMEKSQLNEHMRQLKDELVTR
jgi:predicted nuclease with TOPRIM domain